MTFRIADSQILASTFTRLFKYTTLMEVLGAAASLTAILSAAESTIACSVSVKNAPGEWDGILRETKAIHGLLFSLKHSLRGLEASNSWSSAVNKCIDNGAVVELEISLKVIAEKIKPCHAGRCD